MLIKFYDSEQAIINYSVDEGVYYLNQLADDNASPHAQSVSGPIIAGVSAAAALVGAGVSLTQGIRNLKQTSETSYHVEVTITNKTNYLLGVGEIDKHLGECSDNFIFPGQQGAVTFTERIGPYSSSSSDGSIIYMALISEAESLRFSCGISAQTTKDTSKLIQMSHLTLNDDKGHATSTVVSSHLNDNNENPRFGLFTITTDDGDVFSFVCSQAGTSDHAILNMTILQRLKLPA